MKEAHRMQHFMNCCTNTFTSSTNADWLLTLKITEIKVVLDGVNRVYKDYHKICIFQPHRISRIKDLRKEFSYAFKNSDTVILCPIYAAGEKIKLSFDYLKFAREIIKNSRVKLFLVNDKNQLARFIKKNVYGKKIVIGMGAGSISNWMRQLPQLI